MDFEIATYWNVEPLYYMFNGVAATIQSNDYSGLIKLCMYLGLMVGVLWFIKGRPMEVGKWFFHSLIFCTILNLPVATVTITDKTGFEGPRTVSNVPWTLALGASTFAHARDWLTTTAETVFSLPDDLKFREHDMLYGHRILREANNLTITNPQLKADIIQFFKECTVYDVRDGVVDPNTLLNSANSWDYLFSNTSPARFVTTATLSGNPITDTCVNVAKGTGSVPSQYGLSQRITSEVTNGASAIANKLNPKVQSSSTLGSALALQQLGSAASYLWGTGSSASDIVKQAIFNNAWQESGGSLGQLLQDPAAAAAANATAIAASQNNVALRAQTVMAEETLPRFQNAIEFIVIGLWPLILPMMILQGAEAAIEVLKHYFMTIGWVALWPMLFAILNFLEEINLARKAAWVGGAAGVPFGKLGPFQSMLIDDQAMMGYLVWLVPTIAGGLVFLAKGPLSSAFGGVFHGAQNAVSGAASGAALGNYQTGSQSDNVTSSNMTSANKFSTDYADTSGAMSLRLGNGTTVTRYGAGVSTIAEAQNNLVAQDFARDGARSSSGQTASNHVSSDLERNTGSGHRQGADLNSFVDASRSRGKNQARDSSWGTNDAGGYRFSGDKSRTSSLGGFLNDTFGQQDITSLNLALRGGVSASASTPGGGGGGGGGLGGPSVGASVGADGSLNGTWQADRGRSTGVKHDIGDSYAFNDHRYTQHDGQRGEAYRTGDNSAQTGSRGKRAGLSDSVTYETGERANQREGQSFDDRANAETYRETGSSFDRNRSADLAAKLQARYGVSPMRFAAMDPQQREALLRDYAAENGAYTQPVMPNLANGDSAPSADNVRRTGVEQAASIKNGVGEAYRRDVGQVGAQSLQPVTDSKLREDVDQRISGAQSKVDAREKIIADDHKSLSPRITESLDKTKSRTADVARRSALDTGAVVGVDSNDNLPTDYRRPNEVRPVSPKSDAGRHFSVPDASQAAPAEAPSNKPPVDPMASMAIYNVPELDVAPGKPPADYEANVAPAAAPAPAPAAAPAPAPAAAPAPAPAAAPAPAPAAAPAPNPSRRGKG